METIVSAKRPRDTPFVECAAAYFGIPRVEVHIAAFLSGLLIAFKILNMVRYRFDTDESQHMHVIWALAHGLVQYRDIFDNHMPLFHIALAPLFALSGERTTILFWGRFALLPMYAVTVWSTYQIGAYLFSRRVGLWAVIIAGFYPTYLFTSSEFRTDNIWAPLWLMSLVVLLRGGFDRRRTLIAGCLLGLCFAISMKSILLLASLSVSAVIALLLTDRGMLGLTRRQFIRSALTFMGAAALPLLATIIFIVTRGLWNDFRYCVFEHNILPNLDAKDSPRWFVFIFPVAFPLVVYAARKIADAAPSRPSAFRRSFIFLICGFYLSALFSFWKLITRQDFLPYHPLAFTFIAAGLTALTDRQKLIPLSACVAGFEFLLIVFVQPFGVGRAQLETELVRDVLTLTEPADYVFDCKGESIFRQRCVRAVYEPVTLERVRRNLLMDDAAQRCVETRTCVAAPGGGKMPFVAGQFITENYLPVRGWVRVVGGYLREIPGQPTALEFDTIVPASYKIIAQRGEIKGILDGEAYNGARFLEPGRHIFSSAPPLTALAFLWAHAVDLHYSPFHYVPVGPARNSWRP
ncbi:MAG: ArnT family glycosyltransferase [Chthoniobacterales bacterium]